ncbi:MULTISPECIES: DUF4019 domain-containing protein [Vreelandella]|uniref:DUF4019 domain-containing protein n=2 Tax=Vreelandella TaxID=3137766 RepID=A0A7C9JTT8_9GAMM|nr:MULTISPECIES: DUF4019 domain-containing protein [Halomonas]NDL71404.1 DUF4019 domain-containing protein [Halomonas alkaliphila]NYS45622.1 DUF4019 domain-containing protein [Halomonas zhaodongensis]
MSKSPALLLATILLSLTTYAQASVQAAESAALAWLESIDNGEYQQAWEASSPLLKAPLSSSMLARTVELARNEFGQVESRRRIRASRYTSMPGAPDGDYMVFVFQTRFENKARGIETVTPHLENGTWRVSGYYVN